MNSTQRPKYCYLSLIFEPHDAVILARIIAKISARVLPESGSFSHDWGGGAAAPRPHTYEKVYVASYFVSISDHVPVFISPCETADLFLKAWRNFV